MPWIPPKPLILTPTAGAYKTAGAQIASPVRLQYVDVYMDDLLCAAQGDPDQQQSLSKLTICALKEIFPSLLDEVKDSASRKGGWSGRGVG